MAQKAVEVVRQGLGGGVAVGRVWGQRAGTDGGQPARCLGGLERRQVHLPAAGLMLHLVGVGTRERRLRGQQVIEYAAQAEDVTGCVDAVHLAPGLLRRHIS